MKTLSINGLTVWAHKPTADDIHLAQNLANPCEPRGMFVTIRHLTGNVYARYNGPDIIDYWETR